MAFDLERWRRDVREARRDLGVSYYRMERDIGILASTIQRTEVGVTEPRVSVAVAISDYLGVDLAMEEA